MIRIAFSLAIVASVLTSPLVAQAASQVFNGAALWSGDVPETGRVVGRVLDGGQGAPLAGVEVVVDGTGLQTVTGVDGRYVLPQVPAGTRDLRFRRIGYRVKRVAGVQVPPGGAVQQDATLETQVVQLEEILVVSAAAERGTVSRALEEQRLAANFINTVSMAQIEKSPDGDAGQAAQRVSGVTVQDGKFVFVRGLGERYTTTTLNGARVPSPEPERREVPLDLFPASLLEGITTAKTFTADQPGDFGGAEVGLRTREFPLRRTISFSTSVGLNDAILGREVLVAPTVGREWLGFAGAARQLPDVARQTTSLNGATQSQVNSIIGSFRNAWSAVPSNGGPSGSAGLSVGGEDPVLGLPIGYVGSLTYSQGPEIRQGERRALAVADGQGGTRPQNEYEGSTARTSVLWGGLLNLSARVGSASKLSLNNLYDRSAENEATHLLGANEEFGLDFDITRLTFTERTIRSHQLAGDHLLMGRHQFQWSATLSGVTRDEPDRSDLVYQAQRDASTGTFAPVAWWGAPRSAIRTFSTLDEDSRNVESSLRLTAGSAAREMALKIGGAYRRTHRDADSRAFDIINLRLDDADRARPAEQIFDGSAAAQGDLMLLLNVNGGRYTATDDNVAGFAQMELPLGRGVRVIAGARVERAQLDVESRSPQGLITSARLDNTDVLPALSINVAMAERQNLRVSVSQTLSRPEYRELSPVSYFEVVGGLTVFGNPGLKRALVRNADLRWEWFPNAGEVVSVGGFAKRFENPIERVIVGTTGASALSYVNADAAHNYGVELELRKSLADLGEAASPFSVFGNLTLMRSRITPGNDSISALTSTDRPMVGQAEYVVNAGLGYTHPRSDLSATLLYNVVGPRIAEAGVLPLPDTYEEARHVVDAALRVPLLRGVSVKLDAKNLLDAPYRTVQGSVARREYRSGRTVSLGFSWSPTR